MACFYFLSIMSRSTFWKYCKWMYYKKWCCTYWQQLSNEESFFEYYEVIKSNITQNALWYIWSCQNMLVVTWRGMVTILFKYYFSDFKVNNASEGQSNIECHLSSYKQGTELTILCYVNKARAMFLFTSVA